MRILVASTLLVSITLASFAPTVARADDDKQPPGALTLETERVVIFKDGYSLFIRRAEGTADADGNVHTFEVPDAAVLGSFWAFSGEDTLLGMKAELVTEHATRTEEADCITVTDLLRANQGKRVALTGRDDEVFRCTIVRVLDRAVRSSLSATHPGAPSPLFHQPSAPAGHVEHELGRQGGQYVLVRTLDGHEQVLPVAEVRHVTGQDLVTKTTRRFESRTVRKRLQLALGERAAGKAVTVRLVYFTPGLRWIPTYRLSGALESDGQLALQAEVLNEVMDLDGVAADMVVGVPHFKFREVVSPLSLEAQLRHALRQAAPQLMSQSLSNAHFASRAGESQGDRGTRTTAIAPELAAAGSGDLFVYSLPALTLRKGGRATVPLWQSTVPLSHLYTLDIALGRDARGGKTYIQHRGALASRGRHSNQPSPLDLAEHKVWHQFQLTNDSEVPWTTGAALTMRGHLPLGQDMLTYTSIGAKALLPLTVAVDVCADYDEEEVQREPNAARWAGNRYARITKKAKLKLCNYRKEATTTRVRLGLGGRVLDASDGGEVKLNDFRSDDWTNNSYAARGINNHSDVEWNLELAPGETKYITLTYEFYVRN